MLGVKDVVQSTLPLRECEKLDSKQIQLTKNLAVEVVGGLIQKRKGKKVNNKPCR
jgi:hypothetical protein